MTTTPATADLAPPTHPAAPADPAAPTERGGYLLGKVGAVGLVLGPVLFAAGIATAPEQSETTRESFVQSLADHPAQSILSGNLLHYSWLAWVLGLVAVLGLVRGRGRGHALVKVSAVLGILGAVQISGLMFTDFLMLALTDDVPVETVAGAFDNLDPASFVWLFSAQVMALLFVPLTLVALARTGHLRWFVAVPALVGFVAMAAPLPLQLGVLVGLACFTPAFLVARMLWRGPDAA